MEYPLTELMGTPDGKNATRITTNFYLGIFCEGTVIFMYPIGQCKVSLLRHHVSRNITMSMHFIFLSMSWSAVLFPEDEECKPCVFQQLILNNFMDKIQ